MKLKDTCSLEEKLWHLDSVFKGKEITLSTKVRLVKAMAFSSSHVWMWELNHKESWAPKNWWFWTVVLQKTLESPWLYSHGILPGQNTGMGSLSLLQEIFASQGSNRGLPHYRRILYQLNPQGSPRILEWVLDTGVGIESWSWSLLQQIFLTQESNQGLLHYRWILY